MTLIVRVTAAELMHKAATGTFRTIHIAPAITVWPFQNKNKDKNIFLLYKETKA